MKRLTVVTVVLACYMLGFGSLASGGSLADLDEKNGFRDMKCGGPITEEMRPALSQDAGSDTKTMKRSESPVIGAGRVYTLSYTFYKGQLEYVIMNLQGLSDSDAVRQVFEVAYGVPSQPNKSVKEYRWLGAKLGIFFDYLQGTDNARVIISCYSIVNKEKHDNQIKTQKGKDDL